MLSLLPTAQHYDVLISLTHHFTQTGISEIAPGTIVPASKIWLNFSYQPIQFVLSAIAQLENQAPHPWVDASSDLKAQHPNNPESIDLPNRIDNPESDSDSTDGIEPTAPVAPPETDNAKGQESIFSPVPSPVTSPVTDDKPQPKDIKKFEIEVDGIPVMVSYNPQWGAGIDTVHFEFRSPVKPPQPIPCSETGYHSHFSTAQAVEEYGSPKAYATAYIELNRIKAFKPKKPKTEEGTPETDEQMALTLDFNPTASDEPETDPEVTAALQASLDALCPLTVGEVVEISESLHPKHTARSHVGKWGKIAKLDSDFDTATIELIDNGDRFTIPTLYLERVKLPEVTYLGKSETVGYTTIDGELRGWLGFKTKTLYKEWCCRARTHNARLKGIGEPKRSTHLLKHKWECEVKKPTMKKLTALAEHDLNHNPPPVYTKPKLPEVPPNIRPILEPGTLVEVITKDENGSSKSTGQVGTVIVDYLKNGVVDGIVVKLGKNRDEYLTNGEFRVVDTEPQPENAPLMDNSPQPLAA